MIRKPAVKLEGVEFVRRKLRDAVVLGPARLVSCAFSGCRITCTDFDRRAVVQRVEARRCTATSSTNFPKVMAELERLRAAGIAE